MQPDRLENLLVLNAALGCGSYLAYFDQSVGNPRRSRLVQMTQTACYHTPDVVQFLHVLF